MIGSTRMLRVFAWPGVADLRKGYDGLYGLVLSGLKRDPLTGDCFLFVNRNRNRAKVLFYDGTGLCIYMKRLEKGRFAPLRSDGAIVELTQSELALYLEGCAFVGKVALSPKKIEPMVLTVSR